MNTLMRDDNQGGLALHSITFNVYFINLPFYFYSFFFKKKVFHPPPLIASFSLFYLINFYSQISINVIIYHKYM